jgi:hypothetical protein
MGDYYNDGCDDNYDYQSDDQYYDDDDDQQQYGEELTEEDDGVGGFIFFGIFSGFFDWLFK